MGDIHITIGGESSKPNESAKQSPKPAAAKEDALPDFSKTPDAPPPEWVQKAIAAHQSGKAMVPIFVAPELAKDLEKYYGPHGVVAAHNPDEHGPFGHMLPEEQKE